MADKMPFHVALGLGGDKLPTSKAAAGEEVHDSPEDAPMHAGARDLIDAVHAKDHKGVMDAMSAMMMHHMMRSSGE